MQKNSLKDIIRQWFIPIFCFFIIMVVIVINFLIVSEKAITNLDERYNEQVCKSLADGIESRISTITSISGGMQNMVETQEENNTVYLMDTVDAIVSSCDAYMAAYCWRSGDAIFPEGVSGSLVDAVYYDKLQGKENFFLYTPDDGITGNEAFLYVCPEEWLGVVNGYLITYMNPAIFNEVF